MSWREAMCQQGRLLILRRWQHLCERLVAVQSRYDAQVYRPGRMPLAHVLGDRAEKMSMRRTKAKLAREVGYDLPEKMMLSHVRVDLLLPPPLMVLLLARSWNGSSRCPLARCWMTKELVRHRL